MRINLENLVRVYRSSSGADIPAVNGVSLSVEPNSVFGIIGKSGAGKSTLVRIMSLLEKPDSGAVLYDGERVDTLDGRALTARRRRIGMIFQNFNLFSSRTAAKNVAYPLEICGLPAAEINRRVENLLGLVGLSDRASSPVSRLSGGQKQRVAIARALANNPDVLFCDEATSALDPGTTRSILDLIREIQRKMNLTVVMVTHQMEVVRDACDFVAVLDDGRIAETGTVEEIFTRPQSPVTRSFLANLLPGGSHAEDSKPASGLVRWSEEGGEYILRFVGDMTGEPVLSRLARKFDVEFNIRAGGIQHLPEQNIGTLLTDLSGSKEELARALDYLRSEGVLVEKATEAEAWT
ncbi:MAG: methionine ABC transporter ATP-binding protein [Spirochaetes bacterium]|uniref:Methionine ABC transporter ATP-binding protein n=1 Tax=Candidatus Avitreponema avistercoris TaxID=2840705 RepID=A0A9D9EQ40_9SPIR|nr:methionine ABC transporter ATP-binding protein [Candidatus Avitreponema avistercoris]